MLGLRGTTQDLRRLLEPSRNGIGKCRYVGLYFRGSGCVSLRENEDVRDALAGEPAHKLEINFLRRQAGIDEREDQAKILSMLKVIVHRLVEPGAVFPRHVRESISRQIHQTPALTHGEEVD